MKKIIISPNKQNLFIQNNIKYIYILINNHNIHVDIYKVYLLIIIFFIILIKIKTLEN